MDSLLAFFILSLPATALLPHGRLITAELLIFLFYLSLRKRKYPRPSSSAAALSCFFATVLAALFPSGDMLAVLSALLWVLAAFFPFTSRMKKVILPRALALTGGILGLGAAWEVLSGTALSLWSDAARFGSLARASFPFGNPNLLGAFLAPSAIFALAECLSGKGRKKLLFILLFSFSGLGLLLTYSRGAWLGFLSGSVLFLWQRCTPEKHKTRAACFFPVLPFCRRFLSLFSPDSSVSYRFSLWRSIGKVPFKNLFFGAGEGQDALYRLISPYMAAGLEHVEHTHSLYLHFLTAEGVVGLGLFFLFLFLRRKKEEDIRHTCAFLSLLIYGLFDDPLYSGQIGVLFWILANVN